MEISVFGLGKLGLPLAATIASKGNQVVGVDINKQVVDNLNHGTTKLKEPGLKDLIKRFKKNIKGTDNVKDAILSSDVTFIIIPTPSKANGQFSLKYVLRVIREIAKALKKKSKYHLVVLVSTVMPGSTDKIKKVLEDISGKVCGEDFGLCYNPEFIALGSVIDNLLNPDFVLIGESDRKAGDILQSFYKKYCDNKPKIARMNFVNAELTKISLNTYVTTKISFANMLSEVCEKLPGGNIDMVTSALGLDSRIGGKYLRGGPSYGGPCFPRDNVAFMALARDLKASFDIAQATHKINLKHTDKLTKKVLQYCNSDKRVAILGVSYKPFTDVVDESAGLLLAKALKKQKVRLSLHDPLALEATQKILGNEGIKYFPTLKDCVESSDILVITTDWAEYKNINKSWFGNKPKVVIDLWRMIDPKNHSKNITYLPLGVNVVLE